METFDVIIVGGSYAGLSAAMTLGRSLRTVLLLDSGRPCNRQTPHSHNFLTQDGQRPADIAAMAKEQVLTYPTVSFQQGLAVRGEQTEAGFAISTATGERFSGRKVLFATGLEDEMPEMPGFAACWGRTILHCPYCHGYEVRGEPIGLFANGDLGYELVKLISNWSQDLVLLTNGPSTLTEEQESHVRLRGIRIEERPVAAFAHQTGSLQHVALADGNKVPVTAVFARVPFRQHCPIPEELGCALTQQGVLQVDEMQKTTVPGIYAAGDSTTMFRTVSRAVAAGTMAGAAINKELLEEDFLVLQH